MADTTHFTIRTKFSSSLTYESNKINNTKISNWDAKTYRNIHSAMEPFYQHKQNLMAKNGHSQC